MNINNLIDLDIILNRATLIIRVEIRLGMYVWHDHTILI